MGLSSDDAPSLPVGVTLSGQRQVVADYEHETKVLVMKINEDNEAKRAKLEALGMDAAIAIMEARNQAIAEHSARITEIQRACIDAMELKTPAIQALIEQDGAKSADRISGIIPRYAGVYKTLEEVRNLQSTHPLMDRKTTFIGKVNVDQRKISPQEGGQRLKDIVEAEPATDAG